MMSFFCILLQAVSKLDISEKRIALLRIHLQTKHFPISLCPTLDVLFFANSKRFFFIASVRRDF